MKCIADDNISAVSATSVDPAYPAANVLDNSTILPYRAADQIATMTLDVKGGASGLGLVGLDAKQIIITVRDSEGEVVVTQTVDLSGINNYYIWLTQQWQSRTAYGFTYPLQMSPHTIDIEIDSGNVGTVPEIAVAKAGMVRAQPHARELQLQLVEQGAVEDTFHDGGLYYIEGKLVKEFSAALRLGLDNDFWAFIDGIAVKVKKNPIFWWITDTDNINWFIFGRFNRYPGSPIGNLRAQSKFSIIEEK